MKTQIAVKVRRAVAIVLVSGAFLAWGLIEAPALLGLGGGWSVPRKPAPAPTPEVMRLEGVDLLPGSQVGGFFSLLVNGQEVKFARATVWGSVPATLAAYQRRVALLPGAREVHTTLGGNPGDRSLSAPVSPEYGINLALLNAHQPGNRDLVRTATGPYEALSWIDAQGRRIVVQASAAGQNQTHYVMSVYQNPNVLFGGSATTGDNPGQDLPGVPRPRFGRRILSLAGIAGAGFGVALYEGRDDPAALAQYYGLEMSKVGWTQNACPPEFAPLLQGEKGMTYARPDGAQCLLSFSRAEEGPVYTLAFLIGGR